MREKDTLTTQQFIMESWPDQTPDIQRASAEQVAQVQGILTNLGYQTRTPPPGFHNPPILSTGNIYIGVSVGIRGVTSISNSWDNAKAGSGYSHGDRDVCLYRTGD